MKHASRLLAVTEPRDQIENPSATILMVEDESLVRESTVEFLSGAGFEVISAGNGEEAVLEVQRHEGSIDVLITDLMLANMSGAELAESITTSHPETKVLIVSGHPESEVPRNSDQKWNYFLAKPFSFSVLHSKIRELLQQKNGLAAPPQVRSHPPLSYNDSPAWAFPNRAAMLPRIT